MTSLLPRVGDLVGCAGCGRSTLHARLLALCDGCGKRVRVVARPATGVALAGLLGRPPRSVVRA